MIEVKEVIERDVNLEFAIERGGLRVTSLGKKFVEVCVLRKSGGSAEST